jgi:Fe-S oxidoreductase
MPVDTGDTIGILADNLRLRRSVLPIPVKSAIAWTKGLDLPRGGERVLYTGQMYQLIPYIEDLVVAEEKLGDSFLARFSGFGRQVNKILNISSFMAHPTKAERSVYDRIPRNVALLLRRAGVSFGALFEDDLYSGALIYDLGADEVLKAHAQKVQAVFKKHGVKEVITIDPHTTNMLRSVYPTLIDGYDIKVRNYLEVLAELDLVPNRMLGDKVVIHDSCIFARYEGVVDAPRRLLGDAGLSVREPEHAGTSTWCCGGPVESLYPKKASAQAIRRVEELRAAANAGVTMCPICYINLQKAAKDTMQFDDISDYLLRAFEA